MLSLVLLVVLLPIRAGKASNTRNIIRSYDVRICDQDGEWHKPLKAQLWARDATSMCDGILHFMPLQKFVKTRDVPELIVADGFTFEVDPADTVTSLKYSYNIIDEAWEVVYHGETEMPDLNQLDPGKYLLYITVSVEDPDTTASIGNLAWLIWNPEGTKLDDPDAES